MDIRILLKKTGFNDKGMVYFDKGESIKAIFQKKINDKWVEIPIIENPTSEQLEGLE